MKTDWKETVGQPSTQEKHIAKMVMNYWEKIYIFIIEIAINVVVVKCAEKIMLESIDQMKNKKPKKCATKKCKNKAELISQKSGKEICTECARWEAGY